MLWSCPFLRLLSLQWWLSFSFGRWGQNEGGALSKISHFLLCCQNLCLLCLVWWLTILIFFKHTYRLLSDIQGTWISFVKSKLARDSLLELSWSHLSSILWFKLDGLAIRCHWSLFLLESLAISVNRKDFWQVTHGWRLNDLGCSSYKRHLDIAALCLLLK